MGNVWHCYILYLSFYIPHVCHSYVILCLLRCKSDSLYASPRKMQFISKFLDLPWVYLSVSTLGILHLCKFVCISLYYVCSTSNSKYVYYYNMYPYHFKYTYYYVIYSMHILLSMHIILLCRTGNSLI